MESNRSLSDGQLAGSSLLQRIGLLPADINFLERGECYAPGSHLLTLYVGYLDSQADVTTEVLLVAWRAINQVAPREHDSFRLKQLFVSIPPNPSRVLVYPYAQRLRRYLSSLVPINSGIGISVGIGRVQPDETTLLKPVSRAVQDTLAGDGNWPFVGDLLPANCGTC
jgi:hypothetical protein